MYEQTFMQTQLSNPEPEYADGKMTELPAADLKDTTAKFYTGLI